jgi:hypothetical protein
LQLRPHLRVERRERLVLVGAKPQLKLVL